MLDNILLYTEDGKTTLLNLNLVLKFKESHEVTPRLMVSYSNDPNRHITIPYLWKDFLKTYYPNK